MWNYCARVLLRSSRYAFRSEQQYNTAPVCNLLKQPVKQLFLYHIDSSASTSPWFCDSCKANVEPSCELCPNLTGIFKQTDAGRYVRHRRSKVALNQRWLIRQLLLLQVGASRLRSVHFRGGLQRRRQSEQHHSLRTLVQSLRSEGKTISFMCMMLSYSAQECDWLL